ncbi:MAG: TIGR01244 family phosphatase [Planctomycetes bacterium]|nr:TIGR01244 family phosphatase [Planctomycetota bacterium]
MSKTAVFSVSLLAAFLVALVGFVIQRHFAIPMTRVGKAVFVSAQIAAGDLGQLSRRRIHTIIDLRPDGEDPAQTPSAVMQQAAAIAGIKFHYIPIPHGEINPESVTRLAAALQDAEMKPALLYCRSGNRAVRTYALVLASETGGPSDKEIAAMAVSAGHPVADLVEAIRARIAARTTSVGISQ